MDHSPTWEATSFSASQKIPHTLRNLKIHHHIHKSLSPVPVLTNGQSTSEVYKNGL